MKTFAVILVAAVMLVAGRDGHARPHPRHHVRHAVNSAKHSVKHHRARARQRARTVETVRVDDELVLAPTMLRQMQRNLVDGGYYTGPIDGHLTARTRTALSAFQQEYHLRSHAGALDHATADALLGRDQVLAAATRAPIL
jgi:hypothetical protein